MSNYPEIRMKKNDRKAGMLIGAFSLVVLAVIGSLNRLNLKVELGFDVHIFALFNAFINSTVAVLLISAVVLAKRKNFVAHKKFMIAAMILSILFLVSYITHHILAGDTIYGDVDHSGKLDDAEYPAVASTRVFYLVILLSHIFLAAIILPFILYTAYRGLVGEYQKHRKLAKITWPVWLYVSITGPVLYCMISPYY